MRRASWACCSWLLALLLALPAGAAPAPPLQPATAAVLLAPGAAPPPPDAPWQQVSLPAAKEAPAAWYRVDFFLAELPREPWALYLPYLYGGGRLFINGEPLADIRETSPQVIVRWERPHLVAIPPVLLRRGANQLALALTATRMAGIRMPLPEIGATALLLPAYDNRLFWIRTMSQFTVIACLVVGALSLSIWWRRREEALYGLFGAASLLWGLRTLTLVVEVLPATSWHAWRTLYHAATGGFAIAMLLFAMQLAGLRARRVRPLLIGYWLLGPIGYIATGGNELVIGRFWSGGLLPIGIAVLVITATAAWRRRTAPLLVLTLGLAIAVLAGIHDYLLASAPQALDWIAPRAAAHRVFLLHFAADLLLVGMGAVLAARLVGTLEAIQQLNRTLESRVADSERTLAVNYERMLQLERRHAAIEERQQIMRDLHDGLGSQLFVTLTRAETGRAESHEIAASLRECIADMRLTLEAMRPDDDDFLEAWGTFRFRWQQRLEDAGIAADWTLRVDREPLVVAPHVTVQLLRIVQEALTNVLKHAGAGRVTVDLRANAERVTIEISDDGRGLAAAPTVASHGLANMRARAHDVGARLQITDGGPGVRVLLNFERRAAVLA
jgi:signal transduction histidine kinase